jgi:hypothetical protein
MVQIVGYLLCVYLIYKGIEIFQIGLSSSEDSDWPGIVGWLSLVSSVLFAAGFAYWLYSQGEWMNQRHPLR